MVIHKAVGKRRQQLRLPPAVETGVIPDYICNPPGMVRAKDLTRQCSVQADMSSLPRALYPRQVEVVFNGLSHNP
jgi:hypothetical protein